MASSRTVPASTVGFISLGCAKNQVDSQIMAGHLLKSGLTMAPPNEAEFIVVNTCAFIDPARTETRDAIAAACTLKQKGSCRAVFVAGCYAQRYRRTLRTEFPEVDGFAGLDALDRIGTLIQQWQRQPSVRTDITPSSQRLFDPALPGLRFAQGPYAYLKIAEGCHNRCAFCAIPLIRGPYRSRSRASLVREARALISGGARELNLISQDSMAYGRQGQRAAPANALPSLLKALNQIPGDFWIRLLYGSVHNVSDAVLDLMVRAPKLCRYLDVPIQHSHPDILRAMNRAASARDLTGTLARLRDAVPGLALRTSCLVGFPGETEEHFEHLLRFVEATAFDHLGVFVYSPEAGTRAARRSGRIAEPIAEERRNRLLAVQKKVMARRAKALRDSGDTLLLERPAPGVPGVWLGRSYRQAPEVDGVVIVTDTPIDAAPGTWLKGRYVGRRQADLIAQPA